MVVLCMYISYISSPFQEIKQKWNTECYPLFTGLPSMGRKRNTHTRRERERDYIMQTVLLKTLRGIHHCMSHKCVNVRLIYFCSLIISLLSLSCILLLSLIFLSIRQKERLFCSSTYEACIYAFKDNEIHHTDSINSSLTNADVLTCRQPIKYIVI